MTDFTHTSIQSVVIRASAGSGKTYQLSLRFIALLALGVPPSEIIALTFTRKAAGEFTERILQMLAEGASDEEKASSLREKIHTTWHGIQDSAGKVIQPSLFTEYIPSENLPSLTKDDFSLLLKKLIQELGRLNLKTLDSFFGSMTMMLSTEIGLPSFQMIDEARVDQIQTKVILSLFNKNKEESLGKEELLNAFSLSTLNSDDDRIDRKMKEFIEKYHHAYKQLPQESCWGNMYAVYGLGALWESPKYRPAEFPDAVEALLPIIKEIAPSPSWAQQREKFLRKFIEYGTAKAPFDEEDIPAPFKSNSTFWSNIEKNFYDEPDRRKKSGYGVNLGKTLGQGIADLIVSWVKAEIAIAATNTKGIYQLIKIYDTLYRQLVRERGLFSFDDITRLLLNNEDSGNIANPDTLRYRMDSWYKHWMLDEFQDTSRDQWDVLEPFLGEISMDPDRERSIFIVGDPKQSIYQWRGGEPRIFDSLLSEEPWKSTLSQWNMDASYRSSPTILDFANLICDFRKTAAGAEEEALNRWVYNPHYAGGNNKSLIGHVQVWEIDPRSETTEHDPVLLSLTKLIQRINPLERGLSCVIMTNKNNENSQVAHWLRSPLGGSFHVEMDSDAPIGEDSPLGASLADFFRWLNHPGDRFAWNHVILSPLGKYLNVSAPQDIHREWSLIKDNYGFSGVVYQWKNLLATDPSSSLNDFLLDRLNAWIEAARSFDKEGGSLDEWISLMENIKRKENSTSQSIRVMTIHKSKGLEFDIVILPFVKNDAFDSKSHLHAIARETPSGKTDAFILKPGGGSYKYDHYLSRLVNHWEAGQQFESFCKLYVALTRAKRATYVFVPPAPKTTRQTINAGEIVRNACSSENRSNEDTLDGMAEECLYSNGNSTWYEEHPFLSKSTPSEDVLPVLPPPLVRPNALSPSRSGPPVSSSVSATIRGTNIHALWEKIDWLGSTFPDFLIRDNSIEASLIRECLEVSEIKDLFVLPENSRTQLWKEHPVSGYVQGIYYSGIIDRAVLSGDTLVLIDFKSDICDSPDQLISRYSKQLNIYKEILINALSPTPEKVKIYIISTHFKKRFSLS